MASVTIRIDPETENALRALTRDGRTRSEAVRAALMLAYERGRSDELRAEAEAAAHDPADLAAVREIREEMDALGAW